VVGTELWKRRDKKKTKPSCRTVTIERRDVELSGRSKVGSKAGNTVGREKEKILGEEVVTRLPLPEGKKPRGNKSPVRKKKGSTSETNSRIGRHRASVRQQKTGDTSRDTPRLKYRLLCLTEGGGRKKKRGKSASGTEYRRPLERGTISGETLGAGPLPLSWRPIERKEGGKKKQRHTRRHRGKLSGSKKARLITEV